MKKTSLPRNQIIQGDCTQVLNSLPESSIDLIFADPPYNLQLQQELWRPNMTRVDAVTDEWDQFDDFRSYDEFSRRWLAACRRVLKETGTIWVIGTYHNIYRIGAIMQDLGYWFLNDVIWLKTNPGKKAHSTQKPEALLYRVILASINPAGVVLDPFFGSGTTGAVAKKLQRNWIGIELDTSYIEIARNRIDNITLGLFDVQLFDVRDKKRLEPRIPFGNLLENGLLEPGQQLYFRGDRSLVVRVKPDGNLVVNGFEGFIHQAGRYLMGGSPCNGWDHWYFEDEQGKFHVINDLRDRIRQEINRPATEK